MSVDWKVYIYDDDLSGGADYVIDDNSLPRPNANLSMESIATYSNVVLENGDKVCVLPEKTVHFSPIQLIWTADDGTIYNQFMSYKENGNLLKITTHNESYEFIGRVQTVVAEWIAGNVNSDGSDMFDVAVIFDVTKVLPE